ncbi:MAG: helix-turn-helix transcriptional regulator [Peptococcaceae bacterium]|nr:helix-turn-helix transcriptional regulator [Peptococcaceae bacterium]
MVVSFEMTHMGEMIAVVRQNQGLSQERLGEMIGYSQPNVSRLESGALDITPVIMAAVAVALNSLQLLNRYCSGCPVMAAKSRLERKIRPKAA